MPKHTLLQSQLKKCHRADGTLDVASLLSLVSDAYAEYDRDRNRTDRSIGLMVSELEALNQSLEKSIADRTAELKAVRISLDATLQNTTQGILVIDEDHRIAAFNKRVVEMLELPVDLLASNPTFEEVISYQNARNEFQLTPEEERQGIGSGSIRNTPPLYERERPDGRILEVRTVLLDSGGAVRTFTDVTEEKRQLRALLQAEKLHRSLFENSAAGLYRASLDGRMIDANAALARTHGYETAQSLIADINARSVWRYTVEGRRAVFRDKLTREGQIMDFVSEIENIDTGKRMWTSETAWLVRDAKGEPAYYEGSIIDVSERKQSEEHMLHLATHDQLTGLPNRSFLMNWLNSNIGERELFRNIAIHCIDLDRFKEVNDTFGHATGDQLLTYAAKRMSRVLRSGDFVVRLGGDEFAVVQIGVSDTRIATRLASRLIRALNEDFNLSGKSASVGASIGIATGSFEDSTGEQLLKHADIALYRAKSTGGNKVQVYDSALDAENHRRRRVEQDLKAAIGQSQFLLAYQPILSVSKQAICNYEGLIRWRHPVDGMVPPNDFIPVAEESELINPIGAWVLRHACETFARSSSDAGISVNLSPVQLRQRGFVRSVITALAESGLAPHRLTLEITETVLMSDNAATRTALRDLRSLGIKIALDDFGAGHSSLAYLKKFDFDKIKIDRSFVSGKSKNRVNSALVNAVIGLGRDLDIEVIAEGVETEDQLRDLIALGCDNIQGYLIGVPRPVESWPDLAPLPQQIIRPQAMPEPVALIA